MRQPLLIIAWALGVVIVHATKHHLFAGTFGESSIFGITFDDVTNNMSVQRSTTNRSENEWLAISYDGRTLYSSGTSGWSSFTIHNSTIVANETFTNPPVSDCTQWTGVNIIASRKQPYSVYGSLSCDTAYESTVFNEKAAVYGITMDPTSNYLYTADWRKGQIWTYRIAVDGTLTSLGSVEAPSNVSAPRSIAIHPSGKSLYVVLEGWNAVALYSINSTSHLPVYSKALYTLVPSDVAAGDYGARSASVSTKGSILWVTSYSRNSSRPGYLTGFRLTETGFFAEKLFQVPTPTSGGKSNNVAACPFAENWVALAEAQNGSVSVWKYTSNPAPSPSAIGSSSSKANPTPIPSSGTETTGGGTIKMMANVKISDGGSCCSEAVWLD